MFGRGRQVASPTGGRGEVCYPDCLVLFRKLLKLRDSEPEPFHLNLLYFRQTTNDVVVRYFSHYYPRESEGICFHRRWFVCVCVCVCVCDHDRICTKFYTKVPRGKGKTKFVFRYDR